MGHVLSGALTNIAVSYCVYVYKYRCQQVIEEVIHQTSDTPLKARSSAPERLKPEPAPVRLQQVPTQPASQPEVYHHMIGNSFGVSFNDRSFLDSDDPIMMSGSDRYYYGNYGTDTAYIATSPRP